MQIGMIGLGRMGLNMSRRLVKGGHEVVAFDLNGDEVAQAAAEGAVPVTSIEKLVKRLASPRVVWIMVPSGDPVSMTINRLSELLERGDIVVDGGNSHYKSDFEHAAQLKKRHIRFIDAGVSGGIWGATEGYCIMAGGAHRDFEHIRPLLEILVVEGGLLYCGPTGAGHFIKMIHNGIEYALMEAYGEGFELIKASPYADHVQMDRVADLWNHGSVIRSWLLELIASAFRNDPDLSLISGWVQDSGEGRWTVDFAVEQGVAATAIAHALFKRFQSRQENLYSDRVIAALRREFGGHAVVSHDTGKETPDPGPGSGASADRSID